MASVATELIRENSTIEFSGSFVNDYQDSCRRRGFKQMNIALVKDGALVALINDRSPYESTSEDNLKCYSLQNFKNPTMVPIHTPTIWVECSDEGAVDASSPATDFVTKISLRGWTPLPGTIEVFQDCLPQILTLTHISLWNCRLTEAQFQALAAVILKCNITNLQLDQNPINESLYSVLLSDLSPVKFLTLRSNNITDFGAEAIASALKMNKTLVMLNLYDNCITSKGAEAIADFKALKFNQNVLSLSLAKNPIGNEGVHSLIKQWGKTLFTGDEIAIRKKHLIEIEKRKKELEEEQSRKGVKVKIGSGTQRPGSSLKPDPKKTSQTDLTKSKKGAAVTNAAGKAATGATGKKGAPLPSGTNTSANSTEKGAKAAVAAETGNRKGSSETKKDKKGVAKAGKKKEETKEENDEIEAAIQDMAVDINGTSFIFGNRTLNHLNLLATNIGDDILPEILEWLNDQEILDSYGFTGVFHINLQCNKLEKTSTIWQQIQNICSSRNPFNNSEKNEEVEGEGEATEQ